MATSAEHSGEFPRHQNWTAASGLGEDGSLVGSRGLSDQWEVREQRPCEPALGTEEARNQKEAREIVTISRMGETESCL